MNGDEMSHRDTRIGFIGAGNMGRAMISGLLEAGHTPGCLYVADPDEQQRTRMQSLHADLHVTDDNVAVFEASAVLVLAVKPQAIANVMDRLRDASGPMDRLVISIAAGITRHTLQDFFGEECAVVRIMPNQPAMAGAAMSALLASQSTSDAQRNLAEYIAAAMGRAEWIDDEQMMDAVTAISGSGPAYFYLLAEIVESCAVEMGLPAKLAKVLARQTIFGAGKSVIESSMSLAELRQSVTSKGGTTAAAIAVLEQAGIRDIFREALTAARDRSIELGRDAGPSDTK